jgi:hypothetical protein
VELLTMARENWKLVEEYTTFQERFGKTSATEGKLSED